MIGTIITALVVGAIIGALARLVMPGKQNIGMLITIGLGALGALAGSWISNAMFGTGDKMFSPIPFLIGVVVAVILIWAYVAFTRSRSSKTPTG